MPKCRYIYEDGEWVPQGERKEKPRYHSVITDEMDFAINHADGGIYTSKSNFRKATRAAGCVEVGNEKMERHTPELPPVDKHELAETIRRFESGRD